MTEDCYPKYKKNSWNSTIRKQTTRLKYGPKTLTDILPNKHIKNLHIICHEFSSVTQSCPTFCDPMDYSMPGFPAHHQLLELAQTHVHWVGDFIHYLILCLSLLLLPSIFPSIRIFSNASVVCIRWPKYWSFSISCSNEYSGLISFRINWYNLLVVQGILKSLLQHHSWKVSILPCSAVLKVHFSHPYRLLEIPKLWL